MSAAAINRAREVCMLRDELWTLRPGRQPPLALARTAQLASHRNTSNAHDYIYGLRGLLSPEDQARVPVDYGLSIPELYASATEAILQKDKSASLLGAAVGIGGRKNEYGLASWALNFSSPVKLPAVRDVHDLSESPSIQPSSELHALTTKSRYLGNHIIATLPHGLPSDDIVDGLGSVDQKGGRQVFEQRATEMLCQLLGAGAEAKPKPDIPPFLRLLTGPFYKASLKEGGVRGTPTDLPLDEALHELEGSDAGPSVRLLQLSREALRDSATMTEEVVADLQRQLQGIKLGALAPYHAKVLLLFQYKQRGFRGENGQLFHTSEGLLGKCRGNVEPNDEIWALPGSTTAFVLRPVSGGSSPGSSTLRNARYQLVGPCISDGLIVDRDDTLGHTAQYMRHNLRERRRLNVRKRGLLRVHVFVNRTYRDVGNHAMSPPYIHV
ncbi:HET-domain-containing protein [Apiospora aurea]|uniref:HET-domain-containing protein n=1 Tax=Apiospora aurea TaxID=335848 RepID=A0ABR1QXF7_9PEZI